VTIRPFPLVLALVHAVVGQLDQVAPVFATFGLFGNAPAHPYGLSVRLLHMTIGFARGMH